MTELCLTQLPAAHVPCNGCYECCRNQVVTVSEAFGDDVDALRAHTDLICRGNVVAYQLHQKPNGDCVFLDRKTGCTIYDHRPAVCRSYDCVGQLLGTRNAKTGTILPGPVQKAARRLLAAGHRPTGNSARLAMLVDAISIARRKS